MKPQNRPLFFIALCFIQVCCCYLPGCGKNSGNSNALLANDHEDLSEILQGKTKLDAWVRVDDSFEGMIIEFDTKKSDRSALLIFANAGSSQYGFWTGDVKVKNFRKTGDKKYECLSLCKDFEFEEYERYVVVEKNPDELVFRQRKGLDRPVGEWQRWIRLDRNSKHFPNYLWGKATFFEQKTEWSKSTMLYAKALQLAYPKTAEMYNSLAWRLAVNPDASDRDPACSLELAKKACKMTDYSKAYMLDTLAAAYARNGDFDQAEKYQRKAIRIQYPRDPEFQARLALYIDRKPYADRRK